MNKRQKIWRILVCVLCLALSSCGSGTSQKSGHWVGKTKNGNWSIEFDANVAGQLDNIEIIHEETLNPCSFQITKIPIKTNRSFDQELKYADLTNVLGVVGSINGKFINNSNISGKLTITMCGRTFFAYEKDLPWKANWVQSN